MAEGVGGALKYFWTLVNNWENKINAELKLNCENGRLLVNYSVDLGVWVPPTPRPGCDSASSGHKGPRKGVGPSRQRRRERRAAEKAAATGPEDVSTEQVAAKSVENPFAEKANGASIEKGKNISSEKALNGKVPEEVTAVDSVFEKLNEEEVVTENLVTMKGSIIQFKCDECRYVNNSEKGLKQHKNMKHKIPQTDGADDKDLDEAKGPDISHIVVLRNWEKEGYENVHLLNEVLLEPPAKVYCRVKGIGVYESTCGQGSFCYKFDDGDLMEC